MAINYSLEDRFIEESQGLFSNNDFKVDSTYRKIEVLVNYGISSLRGFNVDLKVLIDEFGGLKQDRFDSIKHLTVPVHNTWRFYLDRAYARMKQSECARRRASHMLALQGGWVDERRYVEANGEDFEKMVDNGYNRLVEKYLQMKFKNVKKI